MLLAPVPAFHGWHATAAKQREPVSQPGPWQAVPGLINSVPHVRGLGSRRDEAVKEANAKEARLTGRLLTSSRTCVRLQTFYTKMF